MSKNTKIIGGIGSIFMILGFIPGINYFILVAITGFIISLISILIIFGITFFLLFFYGIKLFLNIDNIYEFFNLSNLGFGIFFILVSIILMWIISIISAYKWKKADDLLSIKTNENLFESAGLLIFIGSFLNIIFIGIIITIIAYILKAIAFFKTKEKEA